MLEKLVELKKITVEQMEDYILFATTELGRKSLNRMFKDTYMDEPSTKDLFKGVGFAYFDGRRSLIRDIQRTINFVEAKLKEVENDDGRNAI